MKAGQVRGLTLDQLNDELVKLKKEQFNLRFQAASGQLENTARVREIRRDIARIKTISRQTPAVAKGEAKADVKGKAKAEPKAKPAKTKATTKSKSKTTKTKTRAKAKAKG